MNHWIALSLITLGLVALGLLLWRRLPVGTLHGKQIRLHEWHQWRHMIRYSKIDQQLKQAALLEGRDKFLTLARLSLKHGDAPLGQGDQIKEAFFATGEAEALEVALEGMKKFPEWIARPALRGIQHAAADNRLTEEWRRRLFEEIVRHIEDESGYWSQAPETLMALNREDAIEALISDASFTRPGPILADRLRVLWLTNAVVPREHLARLLPEMTDPKRQPQYMEIQFLMHWANHEPQAARQHLKELAWTDSDASRRAAEALLELENLPHPRFGLDYFVCKHGLEGAPVEFRQVWLVDSHYVYPTSVDSLHCIFECESGDYFNAIVEGLEAIGAIQHAKRLRAAGSVFGLDGPPSDQAQRLEMINSMNPSLCEAVDALCNDWPDLEDDELLNLRYVLAHANVFRTISAEYGCARHS